MKTPKFVFLVLLVLALSFNGQQHIYGQLESMDSASIEKQMIKALEWQEQHPIFSLSPMDWTNGAYYTGVARAHMATGNQYFLAALKNMGFNNNWKTHTRLYHADDVAISYAYIYLDALRKGIVDLDPTRAFIETHLFENNKWKDGSDSENYKNILWWWCDALFMAPPVIAALAAQDPSERLLAEMHKYYLETYQLLFDSSAQLFARDTRFQWIEGQEILKEPNGEKIFWSRGNGWVFAGLSLILENLPTDWEYRAFYENLFKKMANRIVSLQPNDGLWRVSLLHPEGYDHGEISGTGFFTFGMAWGINNGLLSNELFLPAVTKAWTAMTDCQQPSGKVGWVQNIGAKPEPANADSWQNYGTGAFLLAGSEILKFKF